MRNRQFSLPLLVAALVLLGRGPEGAGARASVLTATRTAGRPVLWATPLELDFGPVGVGTTSETQTVTITNLGDATLTDFAGGAPPDTQFSGVQTCGGGVAPGASCQYFFTFSPTAAGAFTTTSHSSTNAGPFDITLRGTGAGPEVVVSPFSLDFGSVRIGGTSTEQTVTIRNTGLARLTDFADSPPLDLQFSGVQTCGSGVGPGASCQYIFTFSPAAVGAFTTTSTSSTNAGPFTIELLGRGRMGYLGSGQRVTPRGIDFGPVAVGTASGPLTVTVMNQSLLDGVSDFVAGGVSPPFFASENCGPDLLPGENCQFSFTFSPTAVGVFTATSHTSHSDGSFTITLRGTARHPTLAASPLALDFGPVPLFASSPPQVVTIRNLGPGTLTDFAGGGVAPPFFALQNCAGGVPPGGSCEYTFHFAPTAEGRYSAVSSSITNGGPFSIRLYGGRIQTVFLPLLMR
jgi:hypothetical protein